MLTFTALSASSLRLTGGQKPVVIFLEKTEKADPKDGIVLQSTPEEETPPGVLSWPGEYHEAGIAIRGVGHEEGQQVSYVVEVDGVRCAFLSAPLQDWTDKQLESVGEIDVLVIPASDVKLVQKLVDEFDPRILILLPLDDKDAYQSVLKVIGVKDGGVTEEYKIKGALPAEGREVVVLRK